MGKKKIREQRATMSPFLHKALTQDTHLSQDGGEPDTLAPDPLNTAESPSATYLPEQPITAQILSEQLAQLQNALTATISQTVSAAVNAAVKDLQRDITDLGNRTDKLETYTDDIAQRMIHTYSLQNPLNGNKFLHALGLNTKGLTTPAHNSSQPRNTNALNPQWHKTQRGRFTKVR
uniref:Uncharacterized protein n=1 Tax=Xenopus tropicalis TaxID=8364 RepID=A0A1B8XVU1_XENTR